jgi:hypothetical protein
MDIPIRRHIRFLATILPPVIVCSAVLGQSAQDTLETTFNRYQTRALQEKLFVHLDKNLYLAGETVWLKAYDVDGCSNKPLAISGIAYVEILDKDQKPILQEKIGLKAGKGSGWIKLPSSVPSGHYLFRAYTSWMKNFSADFYFCQQLTILNTVRDLSAAASAIPASSTPSTTPATPATPAPGIPKAYDLRFFPEGGNLVNGVASVVAFKATDRTGTALACQGIITDQAKDTIAHFQTTRFGMGKFIFTPVSGSTYYARIDIGDSVITERLPPAYDQGYTMHLEDLNEHQLRITVHARVASPSSAASSQTPAAPSPVPTVYLFTHTRGQLKDARVNQLNNGEATFLLNKDSMGDGISHLTVFNADRQPVCERLYFKMPMGRLDIAIKPLSSVFETRQKLTVDLSTTDPSGRPVPADLSMSVFLIDSLQSIPDENILSYLLLTSDLKGKIESPGYYFAHPGPATADALDCLMLTQGWTRFRWETVLQNKQPYFEFLPETNGPIVNGKVFEKTTGHPPSPVIGFLTVPGKHFRLSTAVSHPDGNLWFHVGNFYGNKEIVVQTDSNYRIDLANPFSDRFSYASASDPVDVRKWSAQLLYRSINAQVENAYLPDVKQRVLPPRDEDTTAFYGSGDLNFNLDDYVRFVTMDEVVRENVQDVRIRRQAGKAVFRVRNALFNLYFDDDPLLLIDGVPVFNADKLVELDPLRVQKIEVVSHRYFLGPLIEDGIVSFRSYDGQLAGFELDPNALVIQYNGLEEQREFYSPVYDTQDRLLSRIPDYRNQLFWSPEITTDITGKTSLSFYSSDLAGQFALLVQGLTSEGLPGFALLKFTVQPPGPAPTPQ